MILRRLRVRHFLGLVDETFELSPGINVIIGPNEAGKSSLRTAIRAALYGNPGTTAAELDAYRTWGTDQAPVLDLEFEVEGRRYDVVKDFQSRHAVLTGAGEVIEQQKNVQERLVEFLGLANSKVFQSTAEVAQAELERVQLTNLAKELSRVLGGGEDVNAAIAALTQHVREIEKGLKGVARDPGVLKALEERVSSLQQRQQQLAAEAAKIEAAQREQVRLRRPLAEMEADLAAKEQLLELNKESLQLEQRLEALRRERKMLADRTNRIEEAQQELARFNRQLEDVTATGMPDEAIVASARMLAARISHLETRIARASSEPAPPLPRLGRQSPALLALGVVLLTAGLASRETSAVLAGVMGLMGVGALLAGLVVRQRGKGALQRFQSSQQEYTSRLRALEQELDTTKSDLTSLLAALGGISLEEAERRVQRYQHLVQERAEILKVLDALRAEGADDALKDRLGQLDSEIYGLTKELQSPDRAARRLIPLEVQRLEDDVQRLRVKVGEMSERVKRLVWEVDHRKSETEDLAAAEEQLEEAEEALAAARRRHAVYTAALDGLLEARRLVERPVRDVVAARASELLAILSAGRYRRIEVEKDPLQLWVWSADADARVEPREPFLSRGTVDLVYLSLRLALVTALAEGRRPPLLLDDPFITFDERRREAAARLLRELSSSHQVFLFTYTRYYDDVADRVIELPDRTEAAPSLLEPEVRVTPVGPLWERPHQS